MPDHRHVHLSPIFPRKAVSIVHGSQSAHYSRQDRLYGYSNPRQSYANSPRHGYNNTRPSAGMPTYRGRPPVASGNPYSNDRHQRINVAVDDFMPGNPRYIGPSIMETEIVDYDWFLSQKAKKKNF